MSLCEQNTTTKKHFVSLGQCVWQAVVACSDRWRTFGALRNNRKALPSVMTHAYCTRVSHSGKVLRKHSFTEHEKSCGTKGMWECVISGHSGFLNSVQLDWINSYQCLRHVKRSTKSWRVCDTNGFGWKICYFCSSKVLIIYVNNIPYSAEHRCRRSSLLPRITLGSLSLPLQHSVRVGICNSFKMPVITHLLFTKDTVEYLTSTN